MVSPPHGLKYTVPSAYFLEDNDIYRTRETIGKTIKTYVPLPGVRVDYDERVYTYYHAKVVHTFADVLMETPDAAIGRPTFHPYPNTCTYPSAVKYKPTSSISKFVPNYLQGDGKLHIAIILL
jgi:hypothetical protein